MLKGKGMLGTYGKFNMVSRSNINFPFSQNSFLSLRIMLHIMMSLFIDFVFLLFFLLFSFHYQTENDVLVFEHILSGKVRF